MLKKWSIRTTLTLVGLLFVSFAAVVGALSLTGLNTASTSLSALAQQDMVAIRALGEASSYLLRSRITLDRVRSLVGIRQRRRSKKGP